MSLRAVSEAISYKAVGSNQGHYPRIRGDCFVELCLALGMLRDPRNPAKNRPGKDRSLLQLRSLGRDKARFAKEVSIKEVDVTVAIDVAEV